MPNVVVYLSTKDEAALTAEGHDPKKWVREAVKRALSGRDQAGGGASADSRSTRSRPESDEVTPHWKPGKK